MAPEVFFTVVQGTAQPPGIIQQLYSFRPALLRDFCRHRVRYADYPAIVPQSGESVRGVLVTGLTDANFAKLDHFEGSEYRKENVTVAVLDERGDERGEGCEKVGQETGAVVYVFKDEAGVEKGEWDFEHFRKERLHFWSRQDFVFDRE